MEAIQEIDQIEIRIARLEQAIDCCLEDLKTCRVRIRDLWAQREALFQILLPVWEMTVRMNAGQLDESALTSEAPPVSLRETIRRSVCAEPGDYKAIAERLNVKPKQVSAQLSRLHHHGDIGKCGSIYGPPGYCDPAGAGQA